MAPGGCLIVVFQYIFLHKDNKFDNKKVVIACFKTLVLLAATSVIC